MGRSERIGLFTAIALAALWLYGPMLNGGFVWDDFGYVEVFSKFETVGPLRVLQWFWTEREWFAMATYRPVLELSYVYEWRLFGLDPFGYRCSNLVMHVVSASLLAAIVWQWTRVRVATWAVGLLFVISPAHPESLGWLSSRVNLLATMWMLAALFAFVRGRTLIAFGATFLALGSKETAYVLPAMLSAYAWLVPTSTPMRARVEGRAETARKHHSGQQSPVGDAGEAGGSGRRLLEVARRTFGFWLLLALYLGLRYHALGQLFGGYAWRPAPDVLSLEYLRERLELLRVTLAPVNLAQHAAVWVPIVAGWHMLVAGALAAFALTSRAPSRRTLARCAAFVFVWFALSNVPIYNAPFSARTVTLLESSRLLYEPTAALVAGCGVVLAVVGARLRLALLLPWLLAHAWLAFGNVGPWVVVERSSAAISEFARVHGHTSAKRQLIADLPATHAGAFLFPDRAPALNPFVHGKEAAAAIELARGVDGARTLEWIEHARADGAADAELWRAELVDERSVRIVPEPFDARFPFALGDRCEVRYARLSRFSIRAGGDLELDLAFEVRAGASHAPLTLRIIDTADGRIVDRFVRGAAEGEGVRRQLITLPLRTDIVVQRPLRLELEVDGFVGALAEFEVSPPRGSW